MAWGVRDGLWGVPPLCSQALLFLSCSTKITSLKAQEEKPHTDTPWHSTGKRIKPSIPPALWHSACVRGKHSGSCRTQGNLGLRCQLHEAQICTVITSVSLTLSAWDEQLLHPLAAWPVWCHVPFAWQAAPSVQGGWQSPDTNGTWRPGHYPASKAKCIPGTLPPMRVLKKTWNFTLLYYISLAGHKGVFRNYLKNISQYYFWKEKCKIWEPRKKSSRWNDKSALHWEGVRKGSW